MSESLSRKVTGLHPSFWTRCFPVHFVKFVREPFYGTIRSSRHEVFCKKGVLRNFPKFIGKHLYQSLNKVADLRPEVCNFIKKVATVFLRKISALNGCLLKNWNIEIFFYLPMGSISVCSKTKYTIILLCHIACRGKNKITLNYYFKILWNNLNYSNDFFFTVFLHYQ